MNVNAYTLDIELTNKAELHVGDDPGVDDLLERARKSFISEYYNKKGVDNMNNEKILNELDPGMEKLKQKGRDRREIIENKKMSPMEAEELSNRIKGLSREEMDIVADNIPNEILILSLARRMCRYEGIEMSLNNLIKQLGKLGD